MMREMLNCSAAETVNCLALKWAVQTDITVSRLRPNLALAVSMDTLFEC